MVHVHYRLLKQNEQLGNPFRNEGLFSFAPMSVPQKGDKVCLQDETGKFFIERRVLEVFHANCFVVIVLGEEIARHELN